MTFKFEDIIDDYLASQYYTFINGEIKEHAETLLHGFTYFVNEQKDAESVLIILEKALDKLSGLALSLNAKKEIPDLLSSFFSFSAQSGRYPDAAYWEECLVSLRAAFLKKFRVDGSLRGETYIKKYTDVGRNAPCPCGSGLKFKKCCMKIIS
jgi:uncharacterized protein YecA (UPF0149 family)